MEKQFLKDPVKDKSRFDERHRFWTEQALNQFGVASNFFSLLSLGFLAYLFSNQKITSLFIFHWHSTFNYSKVLLIASITFVLISILSSSLTILSRLHDLRLTRHTIWTRKRYYDKTNKLLADNFLDLRHYHFKSQFSNFMSTLKNEDYFISDLDIAEVKTLTDKFDRLRLRNMLLAKFSWWSIKIQIFSLLLSLMLYLFSIVLQNVS